MTTQLALPPIPPVPAPTAPLTAWQAYWDIADRYRKQDRENEYDLEIARHNKALEESDARRAKALEEQATALQAGSANTGELVDQGQTAEERRQNEWVLSIAKDIFVDRTTSTTSAAARLKEATEAVEDARMLYNLVNSVALPTPTPAFPPAGSTP